MIRLFTDGACMGNHGSGGWAVLIKKDGDIQQFGGHDPKTTLVRYALQLLFSEILGGSYEKLDIVRQICLTTSKKS